MELGEAMAALPEVYAEALRLRAAGMDDAQLAARLDVPCSALPSLLRLAAAKLARRLAEPPPARITSAPPAEGGPAASPPP